MRYVFNGSWKDSLTVVIDARLITTSGAALLARLSILAASRMSASCPRGNYFKTWGKTALQVLADKARTTDQECR